MVSSWTFGTDMVQVIYADLIASAHVAYREAALLLMDKTDELIALFEDAGARGSGRAADALVNHTCLVLTVIELTNFHAADHTLFAQ
jgi:hypothetical protein